MRNRTLLIKFHSPPGAIAQRQNMPQAYGDYLRQHIGAMPSAQGRSLIKPASVDSSQRALPIRDQRLPSIRTLSLQETTPKSPRKLSKFDDPHWTPDASTSLVSPSTISSYQQSHYFGDRRPSPPEDTAGSVTSYGSSVEQKVFGQNGLHRMQARPPRSRRESDLSQRSIAHSSSPAMSSSYLSAGGRGYEAPINMSLAASPAGHNGFRHNPQLEPLQDLEKSPGRGHHSSLRHQRSDPYVKEEIVLLSAPQPDYPSYYASHHQGRYAMKRKGAPDSSDLDGPPPQHIHQEGGRRSPGMYTPALVMSALMHATC